MLINSIRLDIHTYMYNLVMLIIFLYSTVLTSFYHRVNHILVQILSYFIAILYRTILDTLNIFSSLLQRKKLLA